MEGKKESAEAFSFFSVNSPCWFSIENYLPDLPHTAIIHCSVPEWLICFFVNSLASLLSNDLRGDHVLHWKIVIKFLERFLC